MRSFLLALPVGAAIVAASGKKCAQSEISALVTRTTCGPSNSIAACLGADVDLESFEEIEQCFLGAGCSKMAAEVDAILFLAQACRPETGADHRDDLRKRADTSTTTATNAKTTVSTEATTTSDASDTSSASAAASSTPAAVSSTTSVDSTTSAASTDSTTTSAQTASTTSPTTCYVTNIKSTSACSVSDGTTVTCTPTTTAIQSCAPGLLCFTATAGAESCMKREDNLTTSGLIVTIMFAGGIGAALLAWAVLCLRSRTRAKRQEQLRRMMASSGKGDDVESISPFATRPTMRSRARGSDANLPLITPGGTRTAQQTYAQQEAYLEQNGPTENAPPPVPKLPSRKEAVGQENMI